MRSRTRGCISTTLIRTLDSLVTNCSNASDASDASDASGARPIMLVLMQDPSETNDTPQAKTMDEQGTRVIDVTNYGTLGLTLQETLQEMQEQEDLPYLPDETVDAILESLATAAATTTAQFASALTDDSAVKLTATVSHYNRLGDKWCIALNDAKLQGSLSSATGTRTTDDNAAIRTANSKKQKKQKSETLSLEKLQVLAYKNSFQDREH